MRDLRLLDARRLVELELAVMGRLGGATVGCFAFPSPVDGKRLKVIASALYGWDHVSVSREDRCPTWEEMEHVKRAFFKTSECAMQIHVPEQEHVSNHPYCLHLWRPHVEPIPRPPVEMVGVKGMSADEARSLSSTERRSIQERELAKLEGRL